MVASGFETTMKEALDRSESRRMQREQERERRRIRDRQRRQSMTVEQRESHLARRRRNYQLRRLRAENAKGDFPPQQISNEHGGGTIDVQEITQIEKLSVENTQFSECLEATVSKLANFPKRLRLSHIRRLARSLNHLGGEVIGNHQVVADVITKADANGSSCIPTGDCDSSILPTGLRFNRVKRLARALNAATNETFVAGQKVEQNPSVEEVIIGDNKPECGESVSVVGEVEGPTMDGKHRLMY